MTIKELEDKISNSKQKEEKIKNTITRHQKRADRLLKEINEKKLDPTNRYLYASSQDMDNYFLICSYDEVLDNIKNCQKKLEKQEEITQNLHIKLNQQKYKEDFFENLPLALKTFLNKWHCDAFEYYCSHYDNYIKYSKELDAKVEEKTLEYSKLELKEYCKKNNIDINKFGQATNFSYNYNKCEKYLKQFNLDHLTVKSKKRAFAGNVVLTMLEYRDETERKEKLNQILTEEKRAKGLDIVKRCEKIVDNIVEASNLRISANGCINGYVVGSNGKKAKIETIWAGGYAVQCLHFRVLVNEIKTIPNKSLQKGR